MMHGTPYIVVMMTLLWTLVACGGTTTQAGDSQPSMASYDSLMGRYWMAYMATPGGSKRPVQRLEFGKNSVHRLVLDVEMAELVNGKPVFLDVEMPCSLAGNGADFLLLNISGGQAVWKVQLIGPDEIRIGQTTFLRGDGALPGNITVQRR